jgi:hypothetical protein
MRERRQFELCKRQNLKNAKGLKLPINERKLTRKRGHIEVKGFEYASLDVEA